MQSQTNSKYIPIKLYDQIDRECGFIRRSKENKTVSKLFADNFSRILDIIVDKELDILSDIYLIMSKKYNPEKDFMEQVKSVYKTYAGCFHRIEQSKTFLFEDLQTYKELEYANDQY